MALLLQSVFHVVLSLTYTYTLYVYLWGVNYPDFMIQHKVENFGNWKFLTFWNLLLQWAFFLLCALADLRALHAPSRRRQALSRGLDFVFGTIVFAVALFVGSSFWGLYSIDRELIFPAFFDAFFPVWLNHAIHTLPLFAVLLEMLFVKRAYPSQRKGFFVVTAFTLLYLFWVLYIAYARNLWVYPILEKLPLVGRAAFIGVCCLVIGLLSILGHALHGLRWGREEEEPTLLRDKRK